MQKTIVFEKDLSLWLEKQCGAVFGTEASGDDSPSRPLLGIASSAFEDYMGPYIRVEEQSMDEQLAEALEDQSVDTRGERPVFISSTKLFISIKGSITRCTALTTGKPFLQLCRCFQESLRKYAHVLDSKLPGPIAGNSISGISIPASFGQPSLVVSASSSAGGLYRLAKFEEVKVCHVISTCEYCVETIEALEDLVRDTIDERHSSSVDMSAIQDGFYDVATKAIRVLVSGLTVRAETGMKNFANTNWGSVESVGEESDYVRAMHEEIEPFVVSLRTLLPTSYFRSFCDKFAASFAALYYESVVRLKRVSEPGSQQLLLDVYNLKTLFLKLPVAESFIGVADSSKGRKGVGGGSTIAPAVFTKMVQSQFGKIETLLKLVGTPNELLIENFQVQWPGGSVAELQVVLALKGLKRAEQVAFLDKLGGESEAARTKTATPAASAVLVSERVQALQDQGSSVAAKVNSDLSQMKLKVDDFRKTWRGGNS
jgi:vacuolar protein sorting-associated protein 53